MRSHLLLLLLLLLAGFVAGLSAVACGGEAQAQAQAQADTSTPATGQDVANPGAPDLGQEPVTDPVPGTIGTVRPLPPLDLGRAPEGELLTPDDDGIIEPSTGTPGAVRPLPPADPLLPPAGVEVPATDVSAAGDQGAVDADTPVRGGTTGGPDDFPPAPGQNATNEVSAPAGSSAGTPATGAGAAAPSDATGAGGAPLLGAQGGAASAPPPVGAVASPGPAPAAPATAPRSRTPPVPAACLHVVDCYAALSSDLCLATEPTCTTSFAIPRGALDDERQCEAMMARAPGLAAFWAQGRSTYDMPDACVD